MWGLQVARWLSTPYMDGKKWYKLSSGFQVAMLLSHVCQTVDLYGFAGMEPRKYFDHESIQVSPFACAKLVRIGTSWQWEDMRIRAHSAPCQSRANRSSSLELLASGRRR